MENKLEKLLHGKKVEILEKWEDTILSSFSPDAYHIFKKQKDPFANPIGHKVRTGLAELYDVLCEPSNKEILTPDLTQLIKMRAVQQVSAADAVSFIFKLKGIVRKELLKKGMAELYIEWLAFDARIDAAALVIFDMFMASKEQVYQVRVNEFQHGRHMITGSICPSALVRRNNQEAIAAEAGDAPDGQNVPVINDTCGVKPQVLQF
ncbi:MAG: RsbRD N-terminal domain-containing protein [Proteobacteria bacterium]|nr:RsbRD N-terminal domain-containing protein [Pseudomonadota bacterium]MBU4297974.1 RsbRD N-terminal domain-containing protein [Pseudomonadota bacterium]MCG2749534.1 RsbRD N-terminal domain-containing protein [Desulfobulbaceae bacterium]